MPRLILLAAALALSHLAQAADISVEGDKNYFSIFIVGGIVTGDEEKFRQAMLRNIRAGRTPVSVRIFSPGGTVPTALHIGRQIRAARMGTSGPIWQSDLGERIAFCSGRVRDEFGKELADGAAEFLWSKNWAQKERAQWRNSKHIRNDVRCTCTSACFLIWAGGVGRQGGMIGVHRPYFDRTEYAKLTIEEAQDVYGRMVERVKTYLREVDVPDAVVRKMMAASSEKMAELTSAEFEEMNNGQDEAREELEIAKCGGTADFEPFLKEWDEAVKAGRRCNTACQKKLEEFTKAVDERQKCWSTVVDVKRQQDAVDSYLAAYETEEPQRNE